MILGLIHEQGVEVWNWIETGFFALLAIGFCTALSKNNRTSLFGFLLLFVDYSTWVIAYRIADAYRNVNQ